MLVTRSAPWTATRARLQETLRARDGGCHRRVEISTEERLHPRDPVLLLGILSVNGSFSQSGGVVLVLLVWRCSVSSAIQRDSVSKLFFPQALLALPVVTGGGSTSLNSSPCQMSLPVKLWMNDVLTWMEL